MIGMVPVGVKISLAERTIGRPGLCIEFFLRSGFHEPFFENEPYHHADRERSPAEAESIDRIVFAAIIATGEFVEIESVALQTMAERPTEHGHGFEG